LDDSPLYAGPSGGLPHDLRLARSAARELQQEPVDELALCNVVRTWARHRSLGSSSCPTRRRLAGASSLSLLASTKAEMCVVAPFPLAPIPRSPGAPPGALTRPRIVLSLPRSTAGATASRAAAFWPPRTHSDPGAVRRPLIPCMAVDEVDDEVHRRRGIAPLSTPSRWGDPPLRRQLWHGLPSLHQPWHTVRAPRQRLGRVQR
jgi:hypothetical protein